MIYIEGDLAISHSKMLIRYASQADWTRDYGQPAWRIMAKLDGEYQSIPLPFANQTDCRIAANALVQAGLTTAQAIIDCDKQELRRILCQDLRW